jgi:hypothetical protein
VTADRRLQAGGWAALLVAILAPLQFVVVRVWPGTTQTAFVVGLLALEFALDLGLLVAAIGLDGLFRPIAPVQASRVRAAGIVGAALALGLMVGDWIAVLAAMVGDGSGPSVVALGWLLPLSSLLTGLWFFLGGTIVMAGGGLARIGWSGMVGGGAMILATVAVGLRLGSATGGAPDELSLRDWFHLIGLFVVIYLVRIWRYVVGGRLPAPGIL